MHVEARREAQVRRAGELVLMDGVAGRYGAEHPSVDLLVGRVFQLGGIRPDRNRQVVQATDMVPVGMGQQDTDQPGKVVPGRPELLARRRRRLVGRTLHPTQGRYVTGDVASETCVDQEVTLRMPHEDRCRREVSLVPEGTTADRDRGGSLDRACGQLVDRHSGGWRSLGKRVLPGVGSRQRSHCAERTTHEHLSQDASI